MDYAPLGTEEQERRTSEERRSATLSGRQHRAHAGRGAVVAAAGDGHLDELRALVRAGAQLEETNEVGSTALTQPANNGQHDCVEFLLGAGADVHAADDEGYTALHYAAMKGQLECARLLVGAGADAAKGNKYGQTVLEVAQPEIVLLLADEEISGLRL